MHVKYLEDTNSKGISLSSISRDNWIEFYRFKIVSLSYKMSIMLSTRSKI